MLRSRLCLNRLQRLMQRVHRIPHRVRKLRIEQQKLQNPLVRQLRRVHPAKRLERRADAQQPNPFQILARIAGVLAAKNFALVQIQQRRNRPRPLQTPSHLQEPPSLAVAQRRIRHALEQMHAVNNRRQKLRQIPLARLRRPQPADLVEQPIQPLPLLRADLVANLPRILARRKNARGNRCGPRRVEAQRMHQRRHSHPLRRFARRPGSLIHPRALRRAHGCQHPLPTPLRAHPRAVQHQPHVDVDQPRSMLRPLQIAARPVQTVSNPRKHPRLNSSSQPATSHQLQAAVSFPAPTYPYCRRPATNSPPAIPAATPPASVRPAQSSPCPQTKCTDANPHAAAQSSHPPANKARAKNSVVGCAI